MLIFWIIDQICWDWEQIIEFECFVRSGYLLVETIQFNTMQAMDEILWFTMWNWNQVEIFELLAIVI
ncbi:hypothetical protein KKA14_22080 [bacterium]|nr:hypothetical protein [bacterium]